MGQIANGAFCADKSYAQDSCKLVARRGRKANGLGFLHTCADTTESVWSGLRSLLHLRLLLLSWMPLSVSVNQAFVLPHARGCVKASSALS